MKKKHTRVKKCIRIYVTPLMLMLRGYGFELFMNAFFPDFLEKMRARGRNKRGREEKKARGQNKRGGTNTQALR